MITFSPEYVWFILGITVVVLILGYILKGRRQEGSFSKYLRAIFRHMGW